MKVSDKIADMYSGYYADGQVREKREITARQTMRHISAMFGNQQLASLIDVGAGDGAVLAEIDRSNIAKEIHAVEISASGCEAIRSRSLRRICSIRQFDGYSIDAPDASYSAGIAVHVLEHVEHERTFLAELVRVCNKVYIEVPLELTMRTDRSIALSGPYGHINFYTPTTFRNLLVTAGLKVLQLQVFANSLDYEILLSGKLKGVAKHLSRIGLLRAMPSMAPFFLTYLAGAVCTRDHGESSTS